MSDIYDEYEAGLRLVVDAYTDLKKLNPQNELLSLIKPTERGFTLVKEDEFNKRYWEEVEKRDSYGKKDEHLTSMYSRVASISKLENDLRDAVRKELRKRLESNQPLEIGNHAICYF